MKKHKKFAYVLMLAVAAIACIFSCGCDSAPLSGAIEKNVRYVSEETMHNESSKQRYFIITGKDTAVYHYWSYTAAYDVNMKYSYTDEENAIATFVSVENFISLLYTEQDIIDNSVNTIFHIKASKNYVNIEGIGEFVNINLVAPN